MAEPRFDYYAGKYKLETVSIATELGTIADITPLVSEFEINASIIDNTNVCKIVIADATNTLGKLPIKGGCLVRINISFGKEDTQEWRYRVARISDIHNAESQRVYTLECISQLAYVSLSAKISRSYRGTASQTAFKIFERYGAGDPFIPQEWVQSSGIQEIVVPLWSPIDAITKLAKRSVSANKQHGLNTFRFYQDSQGKYHFSPIEAVKTLYSNEPTLVYTYNKNVRRKTDGNIEAPVSDKDFLSIEDLKYMDAFDIAEAYVDGNLSGKSYNYDLTEKVIREVNYDYFRYFSKDRYLNPYPQWSNRDPKYFSNITRGYKSTNLHEGIVSDNQVTDDITEIRQSSITGTQAVSIVVKGNPTIDIGQIVELNIPNPEAHGQSQENFRDEMWSGKYFVFAIRHLFNRDEHKIVMDLSKESATLGESA